MAGLFTRALRGAGVELSRPALPLTYDGQGDANRQDHARAESQRACELLLKAIADGEIPKPDFWFSYHVYYKSPDWIGPVIARQLSIPYLVAEGSHAPKRRDGPWSIAHEATCDALGSATRLLAMTAFDRVCLEWINPGRVREFRPFIDAVPFTNLERAPEGSTLRLLSVAMMRNERKRDSFRLLAEALRHCTGLDYRLQIAGDGKFRSEIETYFHGLPVSFLGVVAKSELPRLFAASDVLAWPGIGEAYGLAYLEAQAAGLPVVACKERGVVDVTLEGGTALLSATDDAMAIAQSIRQLAMQPSLRCSMGKRAREFVVDERSLPVAASRLIDLLREILP